jgi:hypothetical protein
LKSSSWGRRASSWWSKPSLEFKPIPSIWVRRELQPKYHSASPDSRPSNRASNLRLMFRPSSNQT